MYMEFTEAGEVWIVKDLKFSTYDEGEDLLHEASYGIYDTHESAVNATTKLELLYPNLPRGNWIIYSEIVYK